MNYIKKVLAAFCAAGMVFAVGCGEEESSSKNEVIYYDDSNVYTQEAEGYENSEGEAVKKEELIEFIPTTPAEVGQKLQVSGMDVKFEKVLSVGTVEAGDLYNYDREVVAVVCEVTNNTEEAVDVTAFDFEIKFLNGENTEIDTGVDAMLAAAEVITDMESFNTTLEPGQTVKGYSSFAVYDKWESLNVYYAPLAAEANDAVSFEITRDMVEELG